MLSLNTSSKYVFQMNLNTTFLDTTFDHLTALINKVKIFLPLFLIIYRDSFHFIYILWYLVYEWLWPSGWSSYLAIGKLSVWFQVNHHVVSQSVWLDECGNSVKHRVVMPRKALTLLLIFPFTIFNTENTRTSVFFAISLTQKFKSNNRSCIFSALMRNCEFISNFPQKHWVWVTTYSHQQVAVFLISITLLPQALLFKSLISV